MNQSVNVDGINLNATHFGAMSAEEGPKRIIADGITTDEAWAKKAHALCVEKVTPKADAQYEIPLGEIEAEIVTVPMDDVVIKAVAPAKPNKKQ